MEDSFAVDLIKFENVSGGELGTAVNAWFCEADGENSAGGSS